MWYLKTDALVLRYGKSGSADHYTIDNPDAHRFFYSVQPDASVMDTSKQKLIFFDQESSFQ